MQHIFKSASHYVCQPASFAFQVSEFDLPVQINGKMRGTINVSKGLDKDSALFLVEQSPLGQKFLSDKSIVKVIFVPNKIINIIVR